MSVQSYLKGFEDSGLTKRESEFLYELVNGVDDDGQPITPADAIKRVSSVKSDAGARNAVYKIFKGGDPTSVDDDTRKQKKQAIEQYIDRLQSDKRDRVRRNTALTEKEIIEHARRVYDVAMGDDQVNKTFTSKHGPVHAKAYETNLTAANAALGLLAKVGGFALDRVQHEGNVTLGGILSEIDGSSEGLPE